jgi:hypothetical protein
MAFFLAFSSCNSTFNTAFWNKISSCKFCYESISRWSRNRNHLKSIPNNLYIYIERERDDSHLHFNSLERCDRRKSWDQTVNKESLRWRGKARGGAKKYSVTRWRVLLCVGFYRGSEERTVSQAEDSGLWSMNLQL